MKFAMKGVRVFGWPGLGIISVLTFLLFTPGLVQAQTAPQSSTNAPQSSTDAQQRERIERQLRELQSLKKDLQRQATNFDARIRALEAELGATSPPEKVAPPPLEATNQLAAPSSSSAVSKDLEKSSKGGGLGGYEPGKGFVLARGPLGELGFGVLGYLRYLNKRGIDATYTDAFGRTKEV